jgi:hypothetical protein
MKKVRIIAAVLSAVMTAGIFAGCAGAKETTPWQDEAKTLVAEKMDDTNVGKFVIDGVKYDFPMAVKDLTDNGWNFETDTMGSTHVTGYSWHPSYINLKNANNKSIEIAVYNESEEASTVAESTVGEVRVSNLRGNAMLSGGIDFYGTVFEAEGVLGDHGAAGFELVLDEVAGVGNVYTKEFKGSNGKNCTATFYFSEYNGNIVLGEVKYECSFEIPYTDAATGMILAVTNNDPSALSSLDNTIEADEFVTEVRAFLAEDFVYSLGFEFETLTDEQYAKVYAILDAIYAQTSFTVKDAGFNTLIVFNAPTNIDDVISAAFDAASEEYEGDSDEAMSDPEYLNLVLDAFDASALEFMPGRENLVTNAEFIEGVYDSMYYMLGFEE